MIDDNSKDYKYLKFLASVASEHRDDVRCRLAALLVHKNAPVALGKNQMKTHPFQAKFGMNQHCIYLHAEIDVLIKGIKELNPEELNKCTLYVARVLKNGEWAIAKPCPGCQKALKAFGIERIVWTIENGYNTSDHESLNENIYIYEARKAANGQKSQNLHLSKYQCSQ